MATGDSVVGEYHRRAEECRLQADKAKSEDDNATWLQLAERWEYIAADKATTKGSIHREAHLEAFHRRIIAIALAHS
jgi:hypothetical protein